jgi:hypothetical protein
LEHKLWPHDRRKLIDELWSMALTCLAELSDHERIVNDQAGLIGRNLEPWRALLAVASWLDCKSESLLRRKETEDQPITGLWQRMEKLSRSYQNERPDIESGDLTVLIIRALLCLCDRDISDNRDVSDINMEGWSKTYKTSQITDVTVEIAKATEADIDTDSITSRRVGRFLGKMRLEKDREAGKGTRQWSITGKDLLRWTSTYGIPLPNSLKPVTNNVTSDTLLSANVTDVTNVTNVTVEQSKDDDYYAELADTHETIDF